MDLKQTMLLAHTEEKFYEYFMCTRDFGCWVCGGIGKLFLMKNYKIKIFSVEDVVFIQNKRKISA